MTGRSFRLALLVLLLLPLVFPAPVRAHDEANILHVGAGGDYPTLAAALEVATPGTTIEVLPGVQTGQWTIKTPLTLIGHRGAVLDGAGHGTLLTVAAPGVTVEGLEIRNSGRSLLDDDAAIRIVNNDAKILDNHLADVHHAVYVTEGAARTVISGNTILGRKALIPEDRGNGIHLWNAPDTLVEWNTVEDVRDGTYVGFAPGSVFQHNTFRRVRYGIHFMYADDNTFEDNLFEQSEAGAALMYSKQITLRRNVFVRSRSSRAYGLLLQECDNVVAQDNILAGNSRALFVNVTRDSVFDNNLFLANDLAVQIYAGATNNRFRGNDFVANMQLVELDQPGSNQWDGNYWDEYRGFDEQSDGYGDLPFTTGDPLGTLVLEHPQLRLFRFSPAVQALELAERALPVIELPAIVDARPALRPVAQASGRLPNIRRGRSGMHWPLIGIGLLGGLMALGITLYGGRFTPRGRPGRYGRGQSLRRHTDTTMEPSGD